MKPRRIARGEKVAAGLVLVRDVAGLPKGRILSEADVRALESAGWPGVEALELEPGDVHEEAAGLRLAAAVAGEGVEPGPVEGGSFPLIARRRGLLEVDLARLAALNLIPDLAVNSHPPQYVAVEGNVVARAKVIPFVTRVERHGVPAYPGTLLWIAYLGEIPVLGAPSCGIFSRATSLDLLLPRIMTGERLRATEIAALAAGGIVAPETSYRLAPY